MNKSAMMLKVHLSILNKGMLMGDDDVINNVLYTKTVIVKSAYAKCYVIDAINFIQRIMIF
jgi:hypothetical protein